MLTLREAQAGDAAEILALVRELADYERLLHEVDATQEGLHAALFGAAPRVFCDIAEEDGGVAGFALWFYNFSTFRGRHGIHLEDLFVRPALRGHGVLDWNEPALAFYRSLGARAMTEWVPHRLTGEALEALARSGDRATRG
jgi:GNAT superfamily N-acetyltransferase